MSTRLVQKKDSVNIRVEAGVNFPKDSSRSGQFTLRVPLTEQVKRITYGKDENVIWVR